MPRVWGTAGSAPVVAVAIEAIADQLTLAAVALEVAVLVDGVLTVPDAVAWRVNGATTGIADATASPTTHTPTGAGVHTVSCSVQIGGTWYYAEPEVYTVGVRGWVELGRMIFADQSAFDFRAANTGLRVLSGVDCYFNDQAGTSLSEIIPGTGLRWRPTSGTWSLFVLHYPHIAPSIPAMAGKTIPLAFGFIFDWTQGGASGELCVGSAAWSAPTSHNMLGPKGTGTTWRSENYTPGGTFADLTFTAHSSLKAITQVIDGSECKFFRSDAMSSGDLPVPENMTYLHGIQSFANLTPDASMPNRAFSNGMVRMHGRGGTPEITMKDIVVMARM